MLAAAAEHGGVTTQTSHPFRSHLLDVAVRIEHRGADLAYRVAIGVLFFVLLAALGMMLLGPAIIQLVTK